MFYDDGNCFACGHNNPIGLKLLFRLDEKGRSLATFVPPKEFQGFAGVLHGGIICTLLDEAMAWAMILNGYLGATASLKVKFRKPVPTGKTIKITGEIIKQRTNSWFLISHIQDESGEVLAEAEGVFGAVSEIPYEKSGITPIDTCDY